MKKYFLKDATLNNIDDDKFRYQDFSNNLRKILECNKSPFNIAIVGKWGLGKSSLINMALAPLKLKENEYLICEINAWRYEKDEIGKAFLKELYECISKQKILSFKFFHKDYDKLVKDNLGEDTVPVKNTNLFKFIIYVLIILALSLVAFFGYCKLSNDFYNISFDKSLDFWKSSFLRYCKNMGSILIIPLIVWLGKLFMDKLNTSASKSYEVSFPLETQADYEIYLRELLGKYCVKNPNKKIVVTIDDLDRLSAEKIVEALDALKIFMEYNEFIFIVPFDDEILKNALDRNKLKQINTVGSKYDGDMVLDKLFQYKIYLPQLIKTDMRNYAFEICKKDCSDFINEFFDGNQDLFEEIAGKILVHNNVSTPRQVKKIINTFIENVMVARDREYAKRVSNGFASSKKGLETIAKISVLQADYNGFYDILFNDANAIDEILQVHRDGINVKPSQVLERYFEINDEAAFLKREYESLVNFLSFTEHLGYSNVTPYLYMAQTEAGVIVGDQKQQDFMTAIESCNFVTAKHFLKETPVLVEILVEQLKYDESLMMGNMVVSAIECFDLIEDRENRLAKAICERISSIINGKLDFRYELINIENLVYASECANSLMYNDLIKYIFKLCVGNENNREKLIVKVSKIRSKLSEDAGIEFEQFVREWIASEDSSVGAIIQFVAGENIEYIANIYGIKYIERIAKHITENDDFENDIISQFGNVLTTYLKKNSIGSIENMIVPCFEYPVLHEVLNISIGSASCEELENPENIADKIVSIGADKLKGDYGYQILTKLSYVVNDEEKEKYDEFFLSIIETPLFANVVLAFSKKNSLEIIPKTIRQLTENSFEIEGYNKDIKVLLDKYVPNQLEQFWTMMTNECGYLAGKEYTVLSDLIQELEQEQAYVEKIEEIFKQVILASLKIYYNKNSYLQFAIQIVNGLKKNLEINYIDEYVKILLKAIPTDTDTVLNAYRTIHLFVSDVLWCANVDTLIDNVSKETYSTIYDIIVSRITLFTKERNNLKQLVTFLVENIKLSTDPDDVINTISNYFSTISNLDVLLHNILDLRIDVENAGNKLSKFIDNLEILKVIQILTEEDIERNNRMILTIISMSQKYSESKILGEICQVKNEMSKTDMIFILEIYESKISNENIGDFLEIIDYLKTNYFEKDVCIKILQMVSLISKNLIDLKKQQVCELITDIFKSSTSDDVKKKCAILIKDKKLSQKVRGMLTKEQLADYKSYLSK